MIHVQVIVVLLVTASCYVVQFKEDPCKMVPVTGWIVVMGDNPYHLDSFTLTDPLRGDCFNTPTRWIHPDSCFVINLFARVQLQINDLAVLGVIVVVGIHWSAPPPDVAV